MCSKLCRFHHCALLSADNGISRSRHQRPSTNSQGDFPSPLFPASLIIYASQFRDKMSLEERSLTVYHRSPDFLDNFADLRTPSMIPCAIKTFGSGSITYRPLGISALPISMSFRPPPSRRVDCERVPRFFFGKRFIK